MITLHLGCGKSDGAELICGDRATARCVLEESVLYVLAESEGTMSG